MLDLFADLDRVETAYRRPRLSHSTSTEESLLAELGREGLGEEWTARDRPSCEVLLASEQAEVKSACGAGVAEVGTA